MGVGQTRRENAKDVPGIETPRLCGRGKEDDVVIVVISEMRRNALSTILTRALVNVQGGNHERRKPWTEILSQAQ